MRSILPASTVSRRYSAAATIALTLLALAWLGLAQRVASSDVAADGTTLRGRVVAEDGLATPLHRARVTVIVEGVPAAEVFSGQAGEFELPVPPSGSYSLRVVKAGFAPRDLPRTADHPVAPVLISLAPGAVVAGRVLDSFGDPAIVPVFLRGEAPLPGGLPAELLLTSDDRGEFRFGSLRAGRYEVYLEVPPPARVPGTDLSVHTVLRDSGPAAIVEVQSGEDARLDLRYHPRADTFTLAVRPGQDIVRVPTADPRSDGRGSIAGRIHQTDGGPVGGASVLLEPVGDGHGQSVLSDAEGRYTFARVQAGTFRIIVVKSGYTAAEYGWTRVPQHGRTIALRRDQSLDGMDVVLPRVAAISGTIVDQYGEPIEGLEVGAWQTRFDTGRLTLVPVATERAGRTDDRGRYRIHGLGPGTYYVAAAETRRLDHSDAEPRRLYYPGRLSPADAAPVRVDVEVDAPGTDVTFDTSAWDALPPVRGQAADASGDPLSGTVVLSASHRAGTLGLPPRTTSADDDGAFEFLDVPPGEYVVQFVQTGLPAFPRAFGREFVTVGEGEIPPTSIIASHGSTIMGRVVLDGDHEAVSPSDFRVAAIPVNADQIPARPDLRPWALITRDDVTFELGGLSGPIRFVADRVPEGWWLQAVTIAGVNAVTEPVLFGTEAQSRGDVQVVFSDAAAEITGRVLDERQQPLRDYSAIVFATDRTRWFARSPFLHVARPGDDGGFQVGSLPPGEYWVAAVDALEGDASGGAWQHPDVLDRLIPGARRVAVGERRRVATELRLMPMPR